MPPQLFLSSSLSSYSRNLDISHNAQLAILKTDIIVLDTACKILVSAHCLTSRLMVKKFRVFFASWGLSLILMFHMMFGSIPCPKVSKGWNKVREQHGERNLTDSVCLNVWMSSCWFGCLHHDVCSNIAIGIIAAQQVGIPWGIGIQPTSSVWLTAWSRPPPSELSGIPVPSVSQHIWICFM